MVFQWTPMISIAKRDSPRFCLTYLIFSFDNFIQLKSWFSFFALTNFRGSQSLKRRKRTRPRPGREDFLQKFLMLLGNIKCKHRLLTNEESNVMMEFRYGLICFLISELANKMVNVSPNFVSSLDLLAHPICLQTRLYWWFSFISWCLFGTRLLCW